MRTKSWMITRRHVLRGLGAAVALPLLDAMEADAAIPGKPIPKRFGALYVPNGVNQKKWRPKGDGSGMTLSPILQPLASVQQHVTVLSGVDNNDGGHGKAMAGWLTGAKVKHTGDPAAIHVGGQSVDQFLAQEIGRQTFVPSLEFGLQAVRKGVTQNGLSNIYNSHISWKSAKIPVPYEIDPRSAYDSLFRHVSVAAQPRAKAKEAPSVRMQESVLDAIRTEAKDLQRVVGRADKEKLEEYFESLREIEKRMEREEKMVAKGYNVPPEIYKQIKAVDARLGKVMMNDGSRQSFSSVPKLDHTNHSRLLLDIMAMAWWADLTRVGTLMFGAGVSGYNMSFLDGVKGNHHSISHHKNNGKQLDMYTRINRYFVENFAYFIQRLDGLKEPNGSVLDNSIVLFGSSIADGNTHSKNNIPLVLGGHGGGKIKGGKHVVCGKGVRIGDVHQTVVQHLGVSSKFLPGAKTIKGLG